MSRAPSPTVRAVSAEIRRTVGIAMIVAAAAEVLLLAMSSRATAAEPGSLLESLISASQLPGSLLAAQPQPPAPSAEPGLIDPAAVARSARSLLPPGVSLATAVNMVVLTLVAYLALRTVHAIWPRRNPGRPVRASPR